MDVDTKDSSWIEWTKEFKKKRLSDTVGMTYMMFKKGHSISKIAKDREFKVESVERHIIQLITKSLLRVEDVIGENKTRSIESVVENVGIDSLTNIKEELPEDFTWFEIKAFMAHLSSRPEKL